jgi:hypothetical protein
MLLAIEPFRRLMLKEGRNLSDIKLALYFIMLISGVILAASLFLIP